MGIDSDTERRGLTKPACKTTAKSTGSEAKTVNPHPGSNASRVKWHSWRNQAAYNSCGPSRLILIATCAESAYVPVIWATGHLLWTQSSGPVGIDLIRDWRRNGPTQESAPLPSGTEDGGGGSARKRW